MMLLIFIMMPFFPQGDGGREERPLKKFFQLTEFQKPRLKCSGWGEGGSLVRMDLETSSVNSSQVYVASLSLISNRKKYLLNCK